MLVCTYSHPLCAVALESILVPLCRRFFCRKHANHDGSTLFVCRIASRCIAPCTMVAHCTASSPRVASHRVNIAYESQTM